MDKIQIDTNKKAGGGNGKQIYKIIILNRWKK